MNPHHKRWLNRLKKKAHQVATFILLRVKQRDAADHASRKTVKVGKWWRWRWHRRLRFSLVWCLSNDRPKVPSAWNPMMTSCAPKGYVLMVWWPASHMPLAEMMTSALDWCWERWILRWRLRNGDLTFEKAGSNCFTGAPIFDVTFDRPSLRLCGWQNPSR